GDAGAADGAGAGLLAKREADVARLVADGLTNKQIGARLFISERTVDSHVRNILNKLGVNSRAQIAAWMACADHRGFAPRRRRAPGADLAGCWAGGREGGRMSRIDVDGVGIEYDVSGAGRPVVLLHGFPDTARLWRHQAPVLAEAGFQVIVPDLRGYGRSDKPEAVDAYSMSALARDVMAILDALQIGKAHVVGHDWGAALAWVMATFAPGNVDHLVVLSVGHPGGFMRTLEQRQKSWYMLLFQFPGVAETWLSADNWANFRKWSGHPDADQVIAQLEADGSLTPGLNY